MTLGDVKFTDRVVSTAEPTETWTFEEQLSMVLLAALLRPLVLLRSGRDTLGEFR